MDQTSDKPLTVEEATTPQPESEHPAYAAWKDAKIRAALAEADADPDDTVTLEQMWKKHGVDR